MRVNGHPLICPHCRGTSFQHKKILLNTKGMALLDLEFLNNNSDTFTCTGCGRIEWFKEAIISEGDLTEDRDCPRCGYFIQAGQTFCRNCDSPS